MKTGALAVGLAILSAVGQIVAATDHRRFERETAAMGVQFRFVAYCESLEQAERVFEAAEQRLAELEGIFSDYRRDSEAMRLVESSIGQPVEVSAELWNLLRRSLDITRASEGSFDVTVGPITHLWRLARKRQRLPEPTDLARALSAVGSNGLELREPNRVVIKRPGMRLDFGAIAKGYAADECLAIFLGHGVESALVDASGDIALGAAPPGSGGWRVGVADLASRGGIAQTLLVSNCGVATSSDAKQALVENGRRHSHIVDPRTGEAVFGRSSVTVIARDATDADGWASALSVLGSQRGVELAEPRADLEALIVVQSSEDTPPNTDQTSGFARFLEAR
jgi:thiamine biosynthesis lipoprotein